MWEALSTLRLVCVSAIRSRCMCAHLGAILLPYLTGRNRSSCFATLCDAVPALGKSGWTKHCEPFCARDSDPTAHCC